MKNSLRSLLTTALLTSLSAGAVQAQMALNTPVYSPKQAVKRSAYKPVNAVPFKVQSAGKGAMVQAVNFNIVDSLQNAFSYYSSGIQPLRYDPVSGQVVTIRRGALTEAEDAVNNLNNLFIHRSNDMGATWLPPLGPVDANDDPGASRYPSIYPFMQGGSGGTMMYVYTFPFIDNSSSNPSFGSLAYGILVESDPTPAVITNSGFTYEGTKFTWGTGSSLITNKDNTKLVVLGNASPEDGSATPLYNIIAVQTVDLSSFEIQTTVPPSLAPSKFPDPGQANFVTVSVVGIDRDDNGNLHMGLFGRFNDNSDGSDARTFGISTSTDGGSTWSDIKILPASVVNAYTAARGVANPDSAGLSYTTDKAFAVTGNGNAHFVTSVLDFRVNATAEERFADMVEVSMKDGNWTIHKMGNRPFTDRSAIPLQLLANDDPEQLDSLSESQMQSELQLSKTADGQYLVAKWIDYRDQSPIFTEDLFAFGDDQAPDTLNVTDVFISVSRTGSGVWTATPVNLTDDIRLDRITWIPDVLPNDLKSIPLLEVQAAQLETDVTDGQILVGQHDVVNRMQYVAVSSFDATVAVGVNETPQQDAASMLGKATPNPASASASISFTVPNSGYATVELYNALGQKVATVFDGMAQGGANTATVRAQELPAGIYYYTLKFNGSTATRTLSIVR